MLTAELPRNLYKLRTWISHLSYFLILMCRINLILRNQHVVLVLRIKAPHVFTVSNDTAIGICNNHLFWISARLNSLWNVLTDIMSSGIDVDGVKAGIVRLRRLSIIEWIWLQMMSTWRSFIHIRNLILVFLIIWRLNCLWDTINKFILLKYK